MRKALRIILWIIAFILFPITAGLYFVWPSKILKERLSPNWRRFWWITYGFVALVGIASKIWFYVLVPLALSYSGESFTTCENVQPSDYHTAEDFRKLTGVEFPELEMVDSLYYDENIIRANTWNEYKFVAKDSLDNTFYRRLNQACEADPSHWSYDKERNVYSYWIYPDQHPVDRSRGMCDRMVTMDDGNLVNDWDGDFISVEIQTDTIVLRKGWLR
jgi:hypothetical protein